MISKPLRLTSFDFSFSRSELASYLGSIFPLFSTAFTPIYGVLLDTLGRKTAMLIAGFFYGKFHIQLQRKTSS